MTRIFLIRHAESEGNIYRRANGHFNGLVTDRGYKQIEKLQERFEGKHFDAVYSSDLSRACTTAMAISRPRELPIQTSVMLREVGMGVWEDTAWGDIEYSDFEMNGHFSRDPVKWSVSGSEPYENVKARMYNFITETAKLHEGETIVFFSHGFAIRSLLCLLKGIPSNETSKMPYCDNTAVTVLIYDGELRLESHSDNSHLSKELSTLAHQTWWRTEKSATTENLRYMPLNEVCGADSLRIFQEKAGDRACVDKQYTAFLVDNPVGILGLDTKKNSKAGIGWLSYIHIIPVRRNNGYGTQLLGMAISDFRKLRREKLRIEVPSGSPGINFLSRHGFSVLDDSDNICLMEKYIRNW